MNWTREINIKKVQAIVAADFNEFSIHSIASNTNQEIERKLLTIIAASVNLNTLNRNSKYSLYQENESSSFPETSMTSTKVNKSTLKLGNKAGLPSKGNFIQSQIDGRDEAIIFTDEEESSDSEGEIEILKGKTSKKKDLSLGENIYCLRNELFLLSIPRLTKRLNSEEYNYIVQSANEIIRVGIKFTESNSQFLNYLLDIFDLYESIDKLHFVTEIVRKYRKGKNFLFYIT